MVHFLATNQRWLFYLCQNKRNFLLNYKSWNFKEGFHACGSEWGNSSTKIYQTVKNDLFASRWHTTIIIIFSLEKFLLFSHQVAQVSFLSSKNQPILKKLLNCFLWILKLPRTFAVLFWFTWMLICLSVQMFYVNYLQTYYSFHSTKILCVYL